MYVLLKDTQTQQIRLANATNPTFLHEQKHPSDPEGDTVHSAQSRASDNLLSLL